MGVVVVAYAVVYPWTTREEMKLDYVLEAERKARQVHQ